MHPHACVEQLIIGTTNAPNLVQSLANMCQKIPEDMLENLLSKVKYGVKNASWSGFLYVAWIHAHSACASPKIGTLHKWILKTIGVSLA